MPVTLDGPTLALAAVSLAALVFAYVSGATDSANVVAPVIASRAMAPRAALVLTVLVAAIAPFIFGLAVARTFGTGVVAPGAVDLAVVAAATLSAIAWRLLTWWWGMPASSSHALVGGLAGAGLAGAGFAAINWLGLIRVLLSLLISPAVGMFTGYLLLRLMYFLAQWATPQVNQTFRHGQALTSTALALSWGANDAQKAAGVLGLALAAAGGGEFGIPLWAVAASMAATALGGLTGGWRLIQTLGGRFYKLRPVHSFSAQAAAAGVILSAAALGFPVSTTQVVSTSILGAGAAQRLNMVRWSVAGDILKVWLFTLPATALLGALFVVLLRLAG